MTKRNSNDATVVGIFSCDINGIIGQKHSHALLWHCSEDLKLFKATTYGHPVVMGRSTREAIGRDLPGRRNFIFSKTMIGENVFSKPQDFEAIRSNYCASDKLFVIGGQSTFEALGPYIDQWIKVVIDIDASDITDDAAYAPVIGDQYKLTSVCAKPAHVNGFESTITIYNYSRV